MFTVLLGKPNRLFHQNRSADSALISVLLNAVLTVSHWYSIFFIVRDIQSDYHRHFTRWLIYVSCALNFVALKCWENCRTYINSLLNWTPAFAHLWTHSLKFSVFFFFNIFVPFPFQKKKNSKCLLTPTKVSALCLDFDEVSGILQALLIRALLSRSSREMKFDSSSWYVKAGLLRFWDNVRVYCKLHILLNQEHIRQDQRAK